MTPICGPCYRKRTSRRPDIQAIAGPAQQDERTDDLPTAPSASGGKGHWSALTKRNRTPLPTRLYYFHTDLNGAPETLTDAQGEIVWSLDAKVWGKTGHEQGEHLKQNIRFQGQYLDRDTGLHSNTFRDYDPHIGRFTTPDPIGLAGGLNLYQYAPNPLGWIDPWGWACKPRQLRNKIKRIRNQSAAGGNRSISGAVSSHDASKLKEMFLGPGYRRATPRGQATDVFISQDGLRQYRGPATKT